MNLEWNISNFSLIKWFKSFFSSQEENSDNPVEIQKAPEPPAVKIKEIRSFQAIEIGKDANGWPIYAYDTTIVRELTYPNAVEVKRDTIIKRHK